MNDVADDGDLGRVLFDQRDQDLRLDGPVLELGFDLALDDLNTVLVQIAKLKSPDTAG